MHVSTAGSSRRENHITPPTPKLPRCKFSPNYVFSRGVSQDGQNLPSCQFRESHTAASWKPRTKPATRYSETHGRLMPMGAVYHSSTVVKTGSLAYGRFLGAHRENTGKKIPYILGVHNIPTYLCITYRNGCAVIYGKEGMF